MLKITLTALQSSLRLTDIVEMLEFLIDNIFVVFQQTIGMLMGTNCALILPAPFLYSYEAEFIQGLLKSSKKKFAKCFNFTCMYIDDVLSGCSYLDYLLEIDDSGKFSHQMILQA